MSGPIVRSGASPEFSKNWDNIFGKPAKSGASFGAATKSKKSAAKSTKKAAGKTPSAKAKPAAKSAKPQPIAKKKVAAKGKKAGKK